jgi:hypothetical protein
MKGFQTSRRDSRSSAPASERPGVEKCVGRWTVVRARPWGCDNSRMPTVSPEELASAYWEDYARREALGVAREHLIAHKRRDGEPDEPETGLEWASRMVESIVTGRSWDDWDAREEGRPERLAPVIDRFALLELLAVRAPDDEAVDYLGAEEIFTLFMNKPDVGRIAEAAERSQRFRGALKFLLRTSTIAEMELPPEDVARLERYRA